MLAAFRKWYAALRWEIKLANPNILSIRVQDENGDRDSTPIPFSMVTTQTLAQVIAAAQAYVSLYDAVTAGVIKSVKVLLDIPLPSGIGTAAVADSYVQSKLGLSFVASGTTKPYTIEIPAIRRELLQANGQPELGTGLAITLLSDAIVAGSGAMLPTNDFGLDLTALDYAKHSFRKRVGAVARTKVSG
jgi:hypothetical protein